jgi:hypothetical protein
VAKEFPSKYFSTMLACVSGTVQTAAIGLALDRDLSAWALKWDLQLLVVVYSVRASTIRAWVIEEPVAGSIALPCQL